MLKHLTLAVSLWGLLLGVHVQGLPLLDTLICDTQAALAGQTEVDSLPSVRVNTLHAKLLLQITNTSLATQVYMTMPTSSITFQPYFRNATTGLLQVKGSAMTYASLILADPNAVTASKSSLWLPLSGL